VYVIDTLLFDVDDVLDVLTLSVTFSRTVYLMLPHVRRVQAWDVLLSDITVLPATKTSICVEKEPGPQSLPTQPPPLISWHV